MESGYPAKNIEMLISRDQRAARQMELLGRYDCCVICLTLNIPGPDKESAGVPAPLRWAKGDRRQLQRTGVLSMQGNRPAAYGF
jgi:phosphoribosyl-dephospho-CoA transferase